MDQNTGQLIAIKWVYVCLLILFLSQFLYIYLDTSYKKWQIKNGSTNYAVKKLNPKSEISSTLTYCVV